jgi:hypothetical protein
MLFLCIDLAERAEKDASFRTSAKSQDRPKVVHGVDHEQLLSGINGHGYSQRRKGAEVHIIGSASPREVAARVPSVRFYPLDASARRNQLGFGGSADGTKRRDEAGYPCRILAENPTKARHGFWLGVRLVG